MEHSATRIPQTQKSLPFFSLPPPGLFPSLPPTFVPCRLLPRPSSPTSRLELQNRGKLPPWLLGLSANTHSSPGLRHACHHAEEAQGAKEPMRPRAGLTRPSATRCEAPQPSGAGGHTLSRRTTSPTGMRSQLCEVIGCWVTHPLSGPCLSLPHVPTPCWPPRARHGAGSFTCHNLTQSPPCRVHPRKLKFRQVTWVSLTPEAQIPTQRDRAGSGLTLVGHPRCSIV